MSSVIIAGDIGGSITLQAPSIAGTTTYTMPTTSGAIVIDVASQTLTNKSLTSPAFTGAVTSSGKITGEQSGLVPSYQYYELNSTVAGANVNTVQSVFGLTNGFTLLGNTLFEFEGLYAMSKSAGTTSHTVGLSFGGTATLNNIAYTTTRNGDGSSFTTIASTLGGLFIQTAANTTTSGSLTNATYYSTTLVKGIVSVNAGGTFLPQYTLSAAPGGAYTTQIGSYFKITPLAAAGANVAIGTVS